MLNLLGKFAVLQNGIAAVILTKGRFGFIGEQIGIGFLEDRVESSTQEFLGKD
ncbi:hypothetical protein [Lyngbya aestuarii]|uniref:hypothetical protein n=1 Tax=Lyngbya aestuarii TaxID=118322 RepID=UPI00403DEFF0